MNKQPWIGKPAADILFILLPPFISLAIVIRFPTIFQGDGNMPDLGWLILVVLIDVAHVYSTLYRTYFDPASLGTQRNILWIIPFVAFVGGVLLYSISDMMFWRILAYVAVFHFVRQQYGFMRLYSRKENKKGLASWIDTITIYYATIYPILFWHLEGNRVFNWFIEGDFIAIPFSWLLPVCTVVYYLVIGVYLIKEAITLSVRRHVNIPKNGIILGTILSWYFGIVYFNGDMAFTLLNVVSHGVPYMALVWLYGEKQYAHSDRGNRFLRHVFSKAGIAIFLGLVFLLAFIEEGLWDIAVWKEHRNIFFTASLPNISLDHSVLSLVVPLLTLPQLTHYILDGFIWKIRHDKLPDV